MKTFNLVDTYKNENRFSSESQLSLDDQRWIQENISSTKHHKEQKELDVNNNDYVYENVIGTCKRQKNSEQTLSKNQAISKLGSLNYRTPCKEIGFYLEIVFKGWNARDGHWLYIAQHYTVKTINCVISEITKQHQRGDTTIQNPAKYFTHLIINFHKKKKKFRGTNGTCKLQEFKKEGVL